MSRRHNFGDWKSFLGVNGILLTLGGCMAFGQAPAAPTTASLVSGFESTGVWRLSTNAATGTTAALSLNRTQGAAALSITTPANNTVLTSLPISSTDPLLTGIGVNGAKFAVDIRFPEGKQSGSLKLAINSAMVGQSTISLGTVKFETLRPSTYQTITFAVTDPLRRALASGRYNDVSFELTLVTPQGTGEYLFDNLRLRSFLPTTADINSTIPDGYGGSVDFDLTGDAPQEKTFDVTAVQVPKGFHLRQGTASGSSVKLELGFAATNIIATCMYLPDTSDVKGKNFSFSSCTGGPQPGDVVSAGWARLSIIGGLPTQRMLPQLALRPVGDLLGSGIIPPMPTWWGDDGTCVPLGSNGVSQSCATEVAAINKILVDYFNDLNAKNPVGNWIVEPTPTWGNIRASLPAPVASGVPVKKSAEAFTISGPRAAGSTPSIARFDYPWSWHLSDSSIVDAFLDLDVGGYYNFVDGTDQTIAHMDSLLRLGLVAMGGEADAISASATAHSDSGQTFPKSVPSSSYFDAHLYIFGQEYGSGLHLDGGKVIPIVSETIKADAPPIQIGIFQIKVGLTAHAGLDLQGGLSPTSFSATLIPNGGLGAHFFGGVGIPGAAAGADLNIDVLDINFPLKAEFGFTPNRAITVCSADVTGTFTGDITASSGGGHLDLIVSVGFCPACWEKGVTIFKWPAFITSEPRHVFDKTVDIATFDLPGAVCSGQPMDVHIITPSTSARSQTVVPLVGTAASRNVSGGLGEVPVACNDPGVTFEWTRDNAADIITKNGKCDYSIVFADTAHQANVTLKVTRALNVNGRTITESGTFTQTVSVSEVPVGVSINAVIDGNTAQAVALNSTEPRLVLTTNPSTGGYIVSAQTKGIDTTNLKFIWTADFNGAKTNITCDRLDSSGIPDSCFTIGDSQGPLDPLRAFWLPKQELGGQSVTVTAINTITNQVVSSDTLQASFYAGPQ